MPERKYTHKYLKNKKTARFNNETGSVYETNKTSIPKSAARFCTDKKCLYLKNGKCILIGVTDKDCIYTAIEYHKWLMKRFKVVARGTK